jgi:hypothetical protein
MQVIITSRSELFAVGSKYQRKFYPIETRNSEKNTEEKAKEYFDECVRLFQQSTIKSYRWLIYFVLLC